jgi:deoxyribose-phosphate aldolase
MESAHALARTFDLSCVRTNHAESDIRHLAEEAMRWSCINAHVLPGWVPLLRSLLSGSDTLVGSPVGFPSGGVSTRTKLVETQVLLAEGVQELDIVMNIGRFQSGDLSYVRDELLAVIAEVPQTIPVKVIIETAVLSNDGIVAASRLVADTGAGFVKTGTGWLGPVTPEVVRLIRASVPDDVQVKASGGIRTSAQLHELADAGATRFGVGISSGLELLKEAAVSS